MRQHQPLERLHEFVQILEARIGGDVDHQRVVAVGAADELAGREENVTFSMPKELRVRSLL